MSIYKLKERIIHMLGGITLFEHEDVLNGKLESILSSKQILDLPRGQVLFEKNIYGPLTIVGDQCMIINCRVETSDATGLTLSGMWNQVHGSAFFVLPKPTKE